jgi:hypothetical protein
MFLYLFPPEQGIAVKPPGTGYRLTQVQVILPPTVSRPFGLGVGLQSEDHDQIIITVGHLRPSCCGAPSLTRGRGCNLLIQSLSLSGSSPAELLTTSYCLVWDSPNLEGQFPVFISPRNRAAQLYPRALGSLYVSSYDSQGYSVGILTASTRVTD